MKKIIYFIAVFFALQGCEKQAFDYEVYQAKVEDVSSLYFSPGSTTLIADGQASLQFVLEAFRSVRIKDGSGQSKDTMMFVDYKSLPTDEVKIFVDGKQVDGMEYSTTDLSKTTISCYAQIGNVKSQVKQVLIRQPKPVSVKRYVDVVFHVFELNPSDVGYDDLIYQDITLKHLEEAIKYANDVFQNKNGKDPNGAAANIEFRLATKNVSGVNLAIPGYNKITYDSSWKASATASFTPANFTSKINSTATYQWNKDKYLNIYILPFALNSTIGNNRAAYQIVAAGESALGGIANTVTSEAQVPTTDFYTNYGLGIHRTVFFPGSDRKIEIASYLGIYYGLYITSSANATAPIDHVADTRKFYSGTNQVQNGINNLLKVGIDGEKFLANNAMDDPKYASLRNCFTQGQVERMRLVMERSPVRKAWSLQ